MQEFTINFKTAIDRQPDKRLMFRVLSYTYYLLNQKLSENFSGENGFNFTCDIEKKY